MKHQKIYWSIFGVVFVVFVLGLFFDLSFAQMIYDRGNFFGKLVASIGETPAYGGLAFVGGGLTIEAIRRKDTKIKVFLFGLAILCVIVGVFLSQRAFKSHNAFDIEDKWYIALPIALVIDGACFAGGFYLTKKSDNERILRVLIFMFTSIVFVLLTVTVLKRIWNRPRYRFIVEADSNLFRNWWQIGFNLKLDSDEFKSCPSGHTSSAACALLLMYLPMFNAKLKNKELILLIIGAIWAALVGFTRHIMGAHFITDTTFAILIAMGIIFVLDFIFFKYKKKIKKVD